MFTMHTRSLPCAQPHGASSCLAMFKRATAINGLMPTLYDVPAEALIDALADKLDEYVEAPEWARYAKAGSHRELAPEQEEFWEHRSASVLRKIAIDGPIGVERLRSSYGGAKGGSNRYQVAPTRHVKGSGNIIRTIIQQLEAADLVEEAGSAGRQVTPAGRSLIDETAGEVLEDLIDDRPELGRYA